MVRYSVLVLLICYGFGLKAATPPPAIDVFVTPVQATEVTDSIEALGTLKANESVALTASVSEVVTAIHFEDGERVQAGDLLVELSSSEEQALKTEYKYTLAEAEAQLKRISRLATRGDASQSLLDEQRRVRDVSKARLTAVESQLTDRQVKAPFDGVVGLREISVGAFVSPGVVLTTLIDDRQLKLDFAVPAIHLPKLTKGMTLVARTRVHPNKTFSGKVVAIDNRVDPVSRTLQIRALLPNADHQLLPGFLMEIDLLSNKRQALVLPEEALTPVGRKQFVYLVQDDQVKRQEVSLGSRWPGRVEILTGLSVGDQVIAHGTDKLSDGSKINIVAREDVSEFLSKDDSQVGNEQGSAL